ncbi:MAG: hypothetical protein WA876_14380 [Candidatus Acidiferrales bacterium]
MNHGPEATNRNQLESLLVEDGEQAIDTLLEETLKPFVGFSRSGQMITKPEFLKLSQPDRLLVCLLGCHVMVRLKLPNASLELAPEALEKECSVPLKNAREHLSRCKARRLLEKNARGYYIPSWAVLSVCKIVKKGA